MMNKIYFETSNWIEQTKYNFRITLTRILYNSITSVLEEQISI